MDPTPSGAKQSGVFQQPQLLPHGLSVSMPWYNLSSEVNAPAAVVFRPEAPGTRKRIIPVVRFVLGVKLGVTPFPKYRLPTPTQCHEIHRLLTQAHGEIKAPEEPEMPSMTIAGCGNVPFVLEALIRTLISQNTTMAQADRAIVNLMNTFPRITLGGYAGSLDWNKVRLADTQLLINAIRPSGNQNKKSDYIKSILQEVWENNERKRHDWFIIKEERRALIAMERNWKTSPNEFTTAAKMDELAHRTLIEQPEILTLDYLHGWDTSDAFERLNQFKGIGVKTAACVLLFCMQRPVFAVDTHVWRFCRWLGWVPNARVTANNTFAHCDVRVPNELKYSLHQLMIIHGQQCKRCNAKCIDTPDAPPCILERHLQRFRMPFDKDEVTTIDEKEEEKDEKEEADNQDTEQADVAMKDAVYEHDTIVRSKYFAEGMYLSADENDTSTKRQRSNDNEETASASKKARSLVDTILTHGSLKQFPTVSDDNSSSSDGIEIIDVHTGYAERIATTNNKSVSTEGGAEATEANTSKIRIGSPILGRDNIDSDGSRKETSQHSSAQPNHSDGDDEYDSDASDDWPSRAPSAAGSGSPTDKGNCSSDDEDNKSQGSIPDHAEESSSDDEESDKEEEEEPDESWPAETDNEDDSDFDGQSSEDDAEYGHVAKRFKPNARELDR